MTDISTATNHHGPVVADPPMANGLSPTKPVPPVNFITRGPEEEEDYTIKCICGFHDDDGNTVLCEHCETWQHTECYYFEDGEVLDVSEIEHYCADCKPRWIDARSATERQTIRRDQSDLGERKVKKASAKNHKKKVKVPDTHVALANGCSSYESTESHGASDRLVESPRDYIPSAKRPKLNHRYSGSLQSASLPWAGNARRSGSASGTVRSPTRMAGKCPSNGYSSESYSSQFLHLYDNDPGDATMQANLFNDITITSSLSLWTQDAEALAEASNGLSPQDIFHRCDQPLDSISMGFPLLHKEHKQAESLDTDGLCPRWTLLTTDAPLVKNSIVGELKGKIGHMRDYVQDPANRWDFLRHPVPFVFFHPKLPIYIDTRREGTKCRYLRRSCRPNLTMTTILENGSDYRFCFVAKDDLEAGSELTIGWTLDQHIRNFFHQRNSEQFKHEGSTDADEDYVSDWVGKVLSDFGGCACDSPAECSLAKYDRRSNAVPNGSLITSNGHIPKGRTGYGKRQSPSIEQTLYNRSYRPKHQEEDDDDRSTSGSLRSKQRSRDITPTRVHTSDTTFAVGLELSDREKRKIAALEKNFEQIEQDKHQPAHKKKKRNSGGPSVPVPASLTSRQPGQVLQAPLIPQSNDTGTTPRTQYNDANTSRRTLGSPAGKQPLAMQSVNGKPPGRRKIPSHAGPTRALPASARPKYISISTQTDLNQHAEWYMISEREQPRKPFMSLSKQLLLRSQRERARMEQRMQVASQQRRNIQAARDPDKNGAGLARSSDEEETQDAGQDTDRPVDDMTNKVPILKPRPPDEAVSQAENTSTAINKPPLKLLRASETITLSVQLPPPAAKLANDVSLGSPGDITQSPVAAPSPFLATSGIHPALFPVANASMVQPSPVKKKVSLVEYMSRRNNKTEPPSTGERSSNSSPVLLHEPVRPPLEIYEQQGAVNQGNAVTDTLNREDSYSTEETRRI
ncbi:MAG: hypothetical protein Q9219_006347 [cf. Caloplaca sp. 3 TL-2023]